MTPERRNGEAESKGANEAERVASERAVDFVRCRYGLGRRKALAYLSDLSRGNLICLDCGSENHTRGHSLCPVAQDLAASVSPVGKTTP